MAMQNYGVLTRCIMAYVKMVNGINSANLFFFGAVHDHCIAKP